MIAEAYKSSELAARIRKIETAILNFGGMGMEKIVDETEMYLIPLLDNDIVDRPITTDKAALKLISEIIKAPIN